MLEKIVPGFDAAQGADTWGMNPGAVNTDIVYGGCATHHVAIWSVYGAFHIAIGVAVACPGT